MQVHTCPNGLSQSQGLKVIHPFFTLSFNPHTLSTGYYMLMHVTYSPLFKTLHSCNGKLGKLVLRVFSCSHVASLTDLSIHLILNSQIILVRIYIVLTLRILSSTCGLEDNSSEVTRV